MHYSFLFKFVYQMQLLGLYFPNTCIRGFQIVWHTTCCYGKSKLFHFLYLIINTIYLIIQIILNQIVDICHVAHTLEESYFEEDEHVRENLHDA